VKKKTHFLTKKKPAVFAVSKRSGEPISEEEAGRLLRPLGQLSEISPLDYETQRKFCLPPSIRIQFTLFDSGRDPVKVRFFYLFFYYLFIYLFIYLILPPAHIFLNQISSD
jgi:hypothetical protein